MDWVSFNISHIEIVFLLLQLVSVIFIKPSFPLFLIFVHTGAKVGPRAWALRSVFVYFIQVDEAEQQCDYL